MISIMMCKHVLLLIVLQLLIAMIDMRITYSTFNEKTARKLHSSSAHWARLGDVVNGWNQQRTPLPCCHQQPTQHCQDAGHWPKCCTGALSSELPQPVAAMLCRLHHSIHIVTHHSFAIGCQCKLMSQQTVNASLSCKRLSMQAYTIHYFDTVNSKLVPGAGCRPDHRVVPSPYPCPWPISAPASKTGGTHSPQRLRRAIKQLVWCLKLWCFLESRLAVFRVIFCPQDVLEWYHISSGDAITLQIHLFVMQPKHTRQAHNLAANEHCKGPCRFWWRAAGRH